MASGIGRAAWVVRPVAPVAASPPVRRRRSAPVRSVAARVASGIAPAGPGIFPAVAGLVVLVAIAPVEWAAASAVVRISRRPSRFPHPERAASAVAVWVGVAPGICPVAGFPVAVRTVPAAPIVPGSVVDCPGAAIGPVLVA